MQMILTYVLAFALTSYYPIKYILISKMDIYALIKILSIVIVLIIATKIIWSKGEARYESSGS